jgi:hypothetical protein
LLSMAPARALRPLCALVGIVRECLIMAPPSHKPERITNRVRPALLGVALIVLVIALLVYAGVFGPR